MHLKISIKEMKEKLLRITKIFHASEQKNRLIHFSSQGTKTARNKTRLNKEEEGNKER